MEANTLSFEIRFESGPISIRSRTLPICDLYAIYQGFKGIERNESQDTGTGSAKKRTKIVVGNFIQSHPFVLSSRHRAMISTVDSHGIAYFAGISRIQYLKLCCLLAATQLRALALNPQLEAEDLPCWRKYQCLHSWQDSFPEYAIIFEKRQLCAGCADFYHTLGAGRELLCVTGLITSLQTLDSRKS